PGERNFRATLGLKGSRRFQTRRASGDEPKGGLQREYIPAICSGSRSGSDGGCGSGPSDESGVAHAEHYGFILEGNHTAGAAAFAARASGVENYLSGGR